MKPGETGIRRVISASKYSAKGLKFAWENEAAFRQEVCLLIILTPFAFWLGETAMQRAVMIGCCFIVLITELLNTAVEAVVDRIGAEHHKLAGSAKDVGSAAVLVSIVMTIVMWSLIVIDNL